MAHKSLIYKNPDADLRLKFRKHMDIAMVGALLILIGVFYAFQKFETEFTLMEEEEQITVQIVAPPPTEAEIQTAPSGPAIPVEAESDEDIEDETIDNTELEFEQMVTNEPPPPPPDDDIIVPFAAVSDRPVLIKRTKPIYPELAKKAGLEGMVTVSVLIGTDGRVERVKVLKSIPMLDEAAVSAAKYYVFTPAKQRDRLVKVWMAIPIHFRLK